MKVRYLPEFQSSVHHVGKMFVPPAGADDWYLATATSFRKDEIVCVWQRVSRSLPSNDVVKYLPLILASVASVVGSEGMEELKASLNAYLNPEK